jgi:hypothetical protein
VPITDAVKSGGGYGFDLNANKAKVFRVKVKRVEPSAPAGCLDIRPSTATATIRRSSSG